MKYYSWDKEKNVRLKEQRDVCFEDVLIAINEGNLLDVIQNPNQDKHPNQKIYVVVMDDYIYLVPFVEDKEKYFLKTIYPSRKMTKKYLTQEE